MIEKHAQILLSIAAEGSFSGAAKQLFLSPQALMKQATKLETDLGFQIFQRTSRGVALTSAGEKLISYLKQQQEEQRRVLEACRVADDAPHVLRLAQCSNTLYHNSARTFAAFRQQNPDVLLRFVHSRPDQLFSDLRKARFDCFLYPRRPEPATDLAFFPLSETRCFCIVERMHPLAEKPVIPLDDLHRFPLFVPTENRNPHVMAILAEHNLRPKSTPLSPLFVCYERGVYIVSMKLDALAEGLKQIPLQCSFTGTTGLVCRTNPSPLLRRLISAAQSVQDPPCE